MASTALNTDEIIEYFDTPEIVKARVEELAKLIATSKHCVIYTGAGISTSAGISDFRGPTGVWTLRAQGKSSIQQPNFKLPTLGHMAIKKMVDENLVKFVVSQNTDGLHVRSGIPNEKIAELHGNTNKEYCKKCAKIYYRDFHTREAYDVHDHKTSRKCIQCNLNLHDTIINFGENLPIDELKKGQEHSIQSDLALVLGTSMRVTPAAELPLLKQKHGKLVICNLQKTPHDGIADIVLHTKTDDLLRLIMERLGLSIPDITFDFRFRMIVDQGTKKIFIDSTSVRLSSLLRSLKITVMGKEKHFEKTQSNVIYENFIENEILVADCSSFNIELVGDNIFNLEFDFNLLNPFVKCISLGRFKSLPNMSQFYVCINASRNELSYKLI